MASKKTKIETPKYKIVADKEHPFFNAYNDCEYISSHDCRSKVVVSEQQMQFILDNPNGKEIAADLKEKYSKYHIYWLEYKYTLAKIEFNNGKSIEEVKNTLLAIKSLAQQCLNDNPNDGWTKIVNHKIDIYIDFLLTKLNQ
jgi:hypothetical protein